MKSRNPPSDVSPSPVGDTATPTEQTFKIPDIWKEAKITIHEAFDSEVPKGCNKKYFWNGGSFELSDSDIPNMKGGLFWVKEKKENPFSSTISEVYIHPYSKAKSKVSIQESSDSSLVSGFLISKSATQLQKKIKECRKFLYDINLNSLDELKEKIRSDSELEINFENKDEKLQVTRDEIQKHLDLIDNSKRNFNPKKEESRIEKQKKAFSKRIKEFSFKENDFANGKVFRERCEEGIKKMFQEDWKKNNTLIRGVIGGNSDDENGLFINTQNEDFKTNLLKNRGFYRERKKLEEHKEHLKQTQEFLEIQKGKTTDDQKKVLNERKKLVGQSMRSVADIQKVVDTIIKNAGEKLKEFNSLYQDKKNLDSCAKEYSKNKMINEKYIKTASILESLKEALVAFNQSKKGYPWTIGDGTGETIMEVMP